VVKVLRDLKAGKEMTPGPQGGRKNCENSAGKTNLIGKVPGPGYGVRDDL
jgi:NADH dehydrogenase (ubiquinone) flavoprotein 2